MTDARRRLLLAALALAAAALAGCGSDDFVAWATVVDVRDLPPAQPPDERSAPYEEQLGADEPQRLELRLEDGSTVTLVRDGERRYEPGERVRVLKTASGRVLL